MTGVAVIWAGAGGGWDCFVIARGRPTRPVPGVARVEVTENNQKEMSRNNIINRSERDIVKKTKSLHFTL